MVIATAGCVTRAVDTLPPDQSAQSPLIVPAKAENRVDILFVVDNSGSMAEEQENLGRNFERFVEKLRDRAGNRLDYRIAVASTDVGVGGVRVSEFPHTCEKNGDDGDSGKFHTDVKRDPEDWEAPCIAGNQPVATCERLAAARQWLVENCDDAALDSEQPWLEPGDKSDSDVARRFRCIGSLGINGCFVEQPLEAARRALKANPDFVRPGAYLAVIFVTDEIECSLADPSLLSIDDPDLPFAGSVGVRCYTHAQKCTGDQSEQVTTENGIEVFRGQTQCEDDPRWLIPVEDYRRFFADEIIGKGATSRVILGGIFGDDTFERAPGPGPVGADIVNGYRHDESREFADHRVSCSSNNGGAAPNRRLAELLRAFPAPDGTSSQASICEDDFSPALEGLARRIISTVDTVCVGLPPEIAVDDPAEVCVLDELGPDLAVRRSSIGAAEGWRIVPGSSACAMNAERPDQIEIDPALRDSFASDSQIRVTCVARQ